jgi:hypothetical protein
MLSRFLRAFTVLTLITIASPAVQAASEQERAERKLEEGADALLEAMRLMLKTIPWYGQPEIKPNGDIVIPRRDAPTLPDIKRERSPSKGTGQDEDTQRL